VNLSQAFINIQISNHIIKSSMKAKITTLSILVLGLFLAFSVVAQPPQTPITIQADTVVTCPGPGVHVMVPIIVKNWIADDSIQAFDLILKFDTNAVKYVAIHDINTDVTALGSFIQNSIGDQWLGTWFTLSFGAPANDTLCVLEFEYKQNWSALTWDLTQVNFYDFFFNPFPTIWENGLIGLTGPFITTQPITTTAPSGTNTSFTVGGTNITAYQWQSSIDGVTYADLSDGGFYSDVTTATLNLSNVNPSIDGTYYRSKTTGPCGDQYSYGAQLLVVSTTPITTTIGTTTYCAGTITVPVLVTDFYDVQNFTLVMDYNTGTTNNLTYANYQNLAVAGSLIVDTSIPNKLKLTYNGSAQSNFGNGTLVELVFSATVGTTGFNWDLSQSEYLTAANSPHFVNFVNANFIIGSLPSSSGIPSGQSNVCSSTLPITYTVAPNSSFLSYVWTLEPPDAGLLTANNNSVAVTFDPTFTGTATLFIYGVNSCGNGPLLGKFITVHIPTDLTITAFDSVCLHAAPVVLTGAAPSGGTYSGPGVYSNSFIADSVGVGTTTITYTYSNLYNCVSTISAPITVNSLPTVSFTIQPYTAICYYNPNFFLGGGDPAGGVYSGAGVNAGIFTPGIGLVGSQNITYTVTGENGCTASAVQTLIVGLCTGVENQSENLSVNVQPNPNNGLFEINVANLTDEATISIFNELGQQVYTEKLSPAAGTNLKLDLSNEPRGMYFLMLNCNGNIQTDKIILK